MRASNSPPVDMKPGPAAPERIRLEYRRPAARVLGLGVAAPRISWEIPFAPPGWEAAVTEIELLRRDPANPAGSPHLVERAEVHGRDQVLVAWPFAPLLSRDAVCVRLRVRGTDEQWSPWSEPVHVEAGLLAPEDWAAQMVGPAWEENPGTDRRPPLVRGEIEVPEDLVTARLYATAHGLVELELNGARVGEEALTPGWSSYADRLRWSVWDVTAMVHPGVNVIGAWLADGWFRGRIGFEGGHRNVWGSHLGVVAQLELTTADGAVHVTGSDGTWTAGFGPILLSGIYDGERYDAREYPSGWSSPGFDGEGFTPVRVLPWDRSTLSAHEGEPVRCTEELAPIGIEARGEGRFLVDFGQNHAGRVRLRPRGGAGATITLRHAEVLEGGELALRPLRTAAQRDEITLAAHGPAEWEPRFTVHGYRYVEVSGWEGELRPEDLLSRVYHSDVERAGWFECSDQDLTRLHENVMWSLRSNLVDVPTDCPQRDERLGWTGDLTVFAPAGLWLLDLTGVVADWMRSVSAEQRRYGPIPWYAPWVPGNFMWDPARPGSVWGDLATVLPAVVAFRRGDRGFLERQWPSARDWVDLVAAHVGPGRVWEGDLHPGDWLDPAAPPDRPWDGRTEVDLVQTVYFAHSAALATQMAIELGHRDDAERFAALAAEVRQAYERRFVTADGRLTSDAETAYALTLAFGLLPHRTAALRSRLVELVAAGNGTITTGFVGTPVILDQLIEAGRADLAYRSLLTRQCPSWLYPVTMGATTTWERWDSMLPDGTINPGEMTSFNHYALGVVADVLYRRVAGLTAAAPGFREIRFAPLPGGGLTRACASHRTPYGTAGIQWQISAGKLRVQVTVPVGAGGVVELPGHAPQRVGHGEHEFEADCPSP